MIGLNPILVGPNPFFVSIEYNSRECENLRALPLCILFFKFMMRVAGNQFSCLNTDRTD